MSSLKRIGGWVVLVFILKLVDVREAVNTSQGKMVFWHFELVYPTILLVLAVIAQIFKQGIQLKQEAEAAS